LSLFAVLNDVLWRGWFEDKRMRGLGVLSHDGRIGKDWGFEQIAISTAEAQSTSATGFPAEWAGYLPQGVPEATTEGRTPITRDRTRSDERDRNLKSLDRKRRIGLPRIGHRPALEGKCGTSNWPVSLPEFARLLILPAKPGPDRGFSAPSPWQFPGLCKNYCCGGKGSCQAPGSYLDRFSHLEPGKPAGALPFEALKVGDRNPVGELAGKKATPLQSVLPGACGEKCVLKVAVNLGGKEMERNERTA
jgi:hypothetical protein